MPTTLNQISLISPLNRGLYLEPNLFHLVGDFLGVAHSEDNLIDYLFGLYESHVNFFVSAESFEDAKARAKQIPEFQSKKMHVDGLQEIQSVDGFRVHLEMEPGLEGKTKVINFKHRDLAPKPQNKN